MQAILGTRMSADLNLIAQIIILAGLYLGYYFARRKKIRPHHANVQTTMVLVNLLLILFVMATSFYNFVILGGTTGGAVAQSMIVHAFLGLVAELSGIYLILRMRTKVIPPNLRIKNFKRLMQFTLALWTVVVLLGLAIYYLRYIAPRAQSASPIAPLQHQAKELETHAFELRDAATRGSAPGVKRHTEHVINLIVGKSSPDYGDLDKDGLVEDPGDGSGILNLLRTVSDQSGNTGVVQVADQVRQELLDILEQSQGVMGAGTYSDAQSNILRIATLSSQIARGTVKSVPQLAQLLNASTSMPTVSPENAPSGTIVVDMQDYEFRPKALTVKKGSTIVFVNKDSSKHTATDDQGAFNSKDIDAGQSFSLTLDQPGVFPYHCEYHGDRGGVDMAGTITVTE